MQEHVHTIAQTCRAAGIRHVIICPGSRSAPLTLAFSGNDHFRCYSIIDERSAGYIALGMAQQLRQPVALICTSGTAALNFYPAIAEAFFQGVPLLVLTADRPPALLYQQDGQMIAQKNVFEKNILGSYELPCSPVGKAAQKEVASVMRTAISLASEKNGPVHVNIPLSEPLYEISTTAEIPYWPMPAEKTDMKFSREVAALTEVWNNAEKKVILIGQMPVDNPLFTALYNLARDSDAVILSDVLSNKQSIATASRYDFIISHADSSTLRALRPDLLISLGGPVLSKSLRLWLKSFRPGRHFRIGRDLFPINTYEHNITAIDAPPAAVLAQISSTSTDRGMLYRQLWQNLDRLAELRIKDFLKKTSFSELHASQLLLQNLPDAINLHLANSSVIRYVSSIGSLDDSWIMSGNRGTSGIDGCSSTAVGAALVNNRQTVLLTGDLAFLYDKNAFWNNHVPDSLRVIVINNNGGGIFTLIDGPGRFPGQLSYFTTPHRQSIKNTAIDNGLEYYFCDSAAGLEKELKAFFSPGAGKAAVLEIRINMSLNTRVYRAFKKIKLR